MNTAREVLCDTNNWKQWNLIIVDACENPFPDSELSITIIGKNYTSDGWVCLANQKNYISLYTCGYHHIESIKLKNPQIKTGKGCINLKTTTSHPSKMGAAIIQHAIEHPKNLSY